VKTNAEIQNMFEPWGATSARSILKSFGIHAFMLGALLLLPAQALLHNAPQKKNVDVDIVFYRPPEVAIAIPAPAAKIAGVPPVAPAPSLKPGPGVDRPAPAKPDLRSAELPAGPPTEPRAEPQPQPTVAKAGILAFKDQFANVAQNKAPRLGADARYVAANDAGQPSSPSTARSMLTGNSPGSSGGINAASLNRSVGGSGGSSGNAGIPGLPLGRANSTIASIAAEDRPKPQSAPAGSRTDEEIQIVFDRYKASFYRLYNRALRNDPALKGQMVLRLTIEPDGTVSMCKVQSSDMKAPDLADQVMNVTRSINFGAKGGPAVTIVYPIDFLPAA
jgi:hypothetical protein